MGLFLADGGEIVKVIEEGAQLGGRVVSHIDLFQGGFDWPDLVFTVDFEEGGSALDVFSPDGSWSQKPPPAGPWLTAATVDGFRFKVRFTAAGNTIPGKGVTPCAAETLCVAGALPERAELFVRVVGPKPNGKLWPSLIKFSTSRVEVWIEQTATGVVRYYDLPTVLPGAQRLALDGLADKRGFDP